MTDEEALRIIAHERADRALEGKCNSILCSGKIDTKTQTCNRCKRKYKLVTVVTTPRGITILEVKEDKKEE